MPRLSPIKAIQLLKILHRLGFDQVRQKGSHIVLQHSDGRETVVPVHQGEEIGRGLLRKIIRDINLTPEQFTKLK
jgi:predicted RNA binding protein YcfA (HicA-like mRNA interferase family)